MLSPHLCAASRCLLSLTVFVFLGVVPLWSQPIDGPGASTGIPFDTTGLPDVGHMVLRFAVLSDDQRTEFAPVAEALRQATDKHLELDFEAATHPQLPDDAEQRPKSIPPCVTVVPVKPEAGGWNPPTVSLVEDREYLPLAVFALRTHAQVLSQRSIGQRVAHSLAPNVYVMGVRPDRLGTGFDLFRLEQEKEGLPSLEPVGGGVWIRSVRVVSAGRPSGPSSAFVMLDRWVTPTHMRLFIWSGPIHIGLLQRLCLQLDVYGVQKLADDQQGTGTE